MTTGREEPLTSGGTGHHDLLLPYPSPNPQNLLLDFAVAWLDKNSSSRYFEFNRFSSMVHDTRYFLRTFLENIWQGYLEIVV